MAGLEVQLEERRASVEEVPRRAPEHEARKEAPRVERLDASTFERLPPQLDSAPPAGLHLDPPQLDKPAALRRPKAELNRDLVLAGYQAERWSEPIDLIWALSVPRADAAEVTATIEQLLAAQGDDGAWKNKASDDKPDDNFSALCHTALASALKNNALTDLALIARVESALAASWGHFKGPFRQDVAKLLAPLTGVPRLHPAVAAFRDAVFSEPAASEAKVPQGIADATRTLNASQTHDPTVARELRPLKIVAATALFYAVADRLAPGMGERLMGDASHGLRAVSDAVVGFGAVAVALNIEQYLMHRYTWHGAPSSPSAKKETGWLAAKVQYSSLQHFLHHLRFKEQTKEFLDARHETVVKEKAKKLGVEGDGLSFKLATKVQNTLAYGLPPAIGAGYLLGAAHGSWGGAVGAALAAASFYVPITLTHRPTHISAKDHAGWAQQPAAARLLAATQYGKKIIRDHTKHHYDPTTNLDLGVDIADRIFNTHAEPSLPELLRMRREDVRGF